MFQLEDQFHSIIVNALMMITIMAKEEDFMQKLIKVDK